ncbi:MAG TPA: cyclic nucleotide-binding domain-containing protein [Acidobacteriota bacterium]|nr:cyclic nucleotide-binding domain-containing protein [Acidobacteriota bacterium]
MSQEKVSAGQTVIRRQSLYQDRWSGLDEQSGIVDLSDQPTPAQLKSASKIFDDFDSDLLAQICPDVSIASWKAGSVFFEEGTYIDLAFLIVEGQVEVALQSVENESRSSRPLFDPERTGIHRLEDLQSATTKGKPQSKRPSRGMPPAAVPSGSTQITLLTNMDVFLPDSGAAVLGRGEVFGEIGALNGWPQSATARAKTDCRLVQIRLPALRLMKRKSPAFKKWVDDIYRRRSLVHQLKATPVLRHCSEGQLRKLDVELESFRRGQTIVEQGKAADAFYIVRSGFVRLSQQFADGQATVTYLSKGMSLGEVELLVEGVENWRCTASSVENSELVKISGDDFRKLTEGQEEMAAELWEMAVKRIKEVSAGASDIRRSEFIEASLGNGLAQGSSVLLIDLNTCTRCDDCVRACAETHGGRPRFVREGDRYHQFLIARSCFHCQDPVCMIGCPTGAIRRADHDDVVEILDDICIGCQACANNCPYDAIVMHDTEELWPADALPRNLREKPRLLASKCDLCYDRGHGPACVSNCPHGCAIRVSGMEDFLDLLPDYS